MLYSSIGQFGTVLFLLETQLWALAMRFDLLYGKLKSFRKYILDNCSIGKNICVQTFT